MNVRCEPIFESDRYKVDGFIPDGTIDVVVISFTERTVRILDGHGFGSGFMLKHNCALIAVKGNTDGWYQDFPEAALSAIDAYLEHPALCGIPRATYGSSMGAYAAIAFSTRLSIGRVLAISPPADILPPWETRWKNDVGTFRSLAEHSYAPHAEIVVAFDPFDPDAKHAAIIQEAAGNRIKTIQVPFGGHPVTRALHEAGCLKPLALAVFRGEPLPDIAPAIRAKRRQGTHYLFVLALNCRDRSKYRWAYEIAKKALAQSPFDAEYNVFASGMAVRNGYAIEAAHHAALAVAINPEHPGMLSHLATILDSGNKPASALVWMDRAVERMPASQFLASERARIAARAP